MLDNNSCPHCGCTAYYPVMWDPPRGLDRRMEKRFCFKCELTYYVSPGAIEAIEEIEALPKGER